MPNIKQTDTPIAKGNIRNVTLDHEGNLRLNQDSPKKQNLIRAAINFYRDLLGRNFPKEKARQLVFRKTRVLL